MASVLQAFITSRGPSSSGESKDGADERVTYKVAYRVQTDSPGASDQIVKNYFKQNSALPWYGRVWRHGGINDPRSICSKIEVKYIERSEGWHDADFTFEPIEGGGGNESKPSESADGKLSEDPLEWRREISITSSPTGFPVQDAIFRGFDPPGIANNLLQPGMRTVPCNSAMIPFDPPPEFDRSFAILRIATRMPRYWEDQLAVWRDVVNVAAFTFDWPLYNFHFRIPQYHGRIKHLGGTYQFENNISHWRIETEIWIHPKGWHDPLADLGTQRRATFGDPDGNGGTISTDQLPQPGVPHAKQILDADGIPVMAPVPLDGNGQPVPLKGEGANKRVWLNYQYYPEGDFAGCPGW